MSEAVSVTPEAVVSSLEFQIGNQGFQVDGGLTDGRYTGEVKLPDGRSFLGIVEKRQDGGWRVDNIDSGETLESPATEIAETVSPESRVDPVVNLESATVLASADSVVPARELEEVAVEVPEIAVMEVSAPVAVEVPKPAVESISVPSSTPVERAPVESRQMITNLQRDMQNVYKPLRAARLWKQAEGIRADIASGKGGVKVRKELMAKMDDLRDKARELHPGIEKMNQASRSELSKKTTPLSAEGPAEAIKMANLKHREDMAVQYEQELQKWEDILNNPAGFEEYRTKAAEIESKRAAARTLYSDESDAKLLAQALARVDQRGNSQLSELRGRFPQRLLELAGLVSAETPTLEQAQSDVDLRLAYNRAAQQLYAELMGQAQAVIQPEMPAMEPFLPVEEITVPVVEATPEQIVETPLTEVIATPQPVVESAGQETSEPEATPAEIPLTESLDPNTPAWLQANLASIPPVEPLVPAASVAPATEPVAITEEHRVPIVTPSAAEAITVIPTEAAPAPETSASVEVSVANPETSGERLDRRKKGFAQANAKLELARNDNAGTDEEQMIRLAESFNEVIGAGIELMKEGDEAKEVVREWLKAALATRSGEKFTEISVKSRLEDAGALPLLGMTPEDRKKKLEEAGLMGFLELLIELGMSFADKTIEAIVGEVQSATGGRG